MGEGGKLVVVTQRNFAATDPSPSDLYKVGVVGLVKKTMEIENGVQIFIETIERVKIDSYTSVSPYFQVKTTKIIDDDGVNDVVLALKNNLIAHLRELINSGKLFPLEAILKLFSIEDPNLLINNLVPLIENEIEQKQTILESVNLETRLRQTEDLINRVLKISELEMKVAQSTQKELSKAQKEIFLREELKAIQKELGESEGGEFEELRNKIEAAGMPESVKSMALREFRHLEKTPSFSPEISYIRNYLDWLVEMPWRKYGASRIDLVQAKKILDQDHYGLQKAKERILEYLAVQKLVGRIRGPILCFVGPPGTGKTSIGQSIAKALGRKFARVSLGGIRDEAEIRGHRRTYVGAMPGRIIQGIRSVKEKNPVFMLDEIDKIGSDFRGDPSSALLEALDPEQNSNFSDHYLEVPFDLSGVIFITTANVLENIPGALRDRMEVIEFPGYTDEEKFYIARKFIWPKIITANGLLEKNIEISDEAIYEVIDKYTKEAGVRNLERELSKAARKIAFLISNNQKFSQVISVANLTEFLGQPKIEKWIKETKNEVGLVAALAVTEGGGEILSIEVTFLPGGKGNLILTGHLGEVMKESAQAALSFARSISPKYGVDSKTFTRNDIHIHVPMGAIPKDGPSAGAAIGTAIVSAALKRPVDAEIGMTGEISLRGRVLRIGGVKEKILAAKRAGLKKVVLPAANKPDLEEISEDYKKGISLTMVNSMDEVMLAVFGEMGGKI